MARRSPVQRRRRRGEGDRAARGRRDEFARRFRDERRAMGRYDAVGATDRARGVRLARWVGAALDGDLVGWDAGFEAVAAVVSNTRYRRAARTVAELAGVAAALLPATEAARRERAHRAASRVQAAAR